MRLTALCILAGLAAGCGVTPDEHVINPASPTLDPHKYGPAHASPSVAIAVDRPHALAPSPAVASRLTAGVVGVVDLSGRVDVRPQTLETSSDATLQDLHWTSWDASGARGSGQLRILDCSPSCAAGPARVIPATITLTSVRECAGRFYFDAAAIHIDPAASPDPGEQPASYLRAPC